MAVTKNWDLSEGLLPFMQFVNVTTTGASDTFVSKFKSVKGCWVDNETTEKGVKTSKSGGTITITSTSGDTLNLLIIGDLN
jgi:hypothetical protein|tara:strand:+ start:8517 stop:8759 length:243 start_codon:yes stop_codon:yes gene_type:complete